MPWDNVVQISVRRELIKNGYASYTCPIIPGTGARCGSCRRGRIEKAKIGVKCRVCGSRVDRIWDSRDFGSSMPVHPVPHCLRGEM